MREYAHKKVEKKWQKVWKDTGLYRTRQASKVSSQKFYALDMFPYPSGEGLHVGHPKGYIATDVVSRMKRMQGNTVLHPMGFDAFGLPAENYAIKTKTNPETAVKKNVARYKKQLELLGFDYDWSREINTTDPNYYRWTQWIFLKMFEKGLAFQSFEPINWCPSCKTGLANEDVEDGKCERCGTAVEKKPMRQWVLKITDYAERLLKDIETVEWPENIKEQQRNWIGKSEGLLFTAPVKGTPFTIKTFSTHFEAFYADTFIVIAPDHPFLPKLLEGVPNRDEVLAFSRKLVEKRLEAGYEEREPEGIFTGRYIVDPVGNGDLPIWVASYALAEYGTGIVKCSAHDERDFKFAKKYNIWLKPVLFPKNPDLRKKVERLEECFTDMKHGVLSEPEEFTGAVAGEHRAKIADYAVRNGFAVKKTMYRLRDWVFSRQRYWGEPIPLIHCDKCGIVPVPEKDLPVKLPKVKYYEPTGTGESPLAGIERWVNVKCPHCGGKARRETNTMPQWAGSSWYYLAYIAKRTNRYTLTAKRLLDIWLPVDLYVGGAEHATRHLIYARFWHKFLQDIGIVSVPEPFVKLRPVGLIMGEDGRKMSKRFGNVINPDDIVERFGADSLRVYEMFMGPFTQAITWNTDGLIGAKRFLERVWRLKGKFQVPNSKLQISSRSQNSNSRLDTLLHQTIKKVTEDIESLRFNTAISALMILVNTFDREPEVRREDFEVFLKLLAPFAPHITEELWALLGNKKSIHLSGWPVFDAAKLKVEEAVVVVQVNGKVRGQFLASTDLNTDDALRRALEIPAVERFLAGKSPRVAKYISGRLISIVSA